MRALITGITGFAGGHLAQILVDRGDQVVGVARRSDRNLAHLHANIEILAADLRQADAVERVLHRTEPEVIYHLAGQAFVPQAWANPWATLENNIRPQLNILQTMVAQKLTTRLLVVASDQVYGIVEPSQQPVSETMPLQPNNPYGVSKATQDILALQYHLSHDLDVIRVRAFNHIGPRQSPLFVSANFAKQIAEIEAQQSEPIIYVGNLEAQRDFTDVYDVMRAYVLLAEKGTAGEVYNVGTGQAHSIQYLLEVLLGHSHCDITIKQDPARMRPSDIPIIYADNRKLKDQTGWQPSRSFEDSLHSVLDYWRKEIKI